MTSCRSYLHDYYHLIANRFLIGREKPGTQSEVARLISETLEQERNHHHQEQQEQHHLDDPYEHSTEEVSQLVGIHRKPNPVTLWRMRKGAAA